MLEKAGFLVYISEETFYNCQESDIMASKVYFKKLNESGCHHEVSAAALALLKQLAEAEKIEFASEVPLKLHFGERETVLISRRIAIRE